MMKFIPYTKDETIDLEKIKKQNPDYRVWIASKRGFCGFQSEFAAHAYVVCSQIA